jgi:hypothetical protein
VYKTERKDKKKKKKKRETFPFKALEGPLFSWETPPMKVQRLLSFNGLKFKKNLSN